eukprot:g5678.t1
MRYEGYDIDTLDERVGKELNNARKKLRVRKTDFYVNAINTRSTLDNVVDDNKKDTFDHKKSSEISEPSKTKMKKNIRQGNYDRVDLDAIFDLNNAVRNRQESERIFLRKELLRLREVNGGEKPYKGQLVTYGEKIIENEMLGGTPRLNSHSADKLMMTREY